MTPDPNKSEALKPCPFCQCAMRLASNGYAAHPIESACLLSGQTFRADKWNTRAPAIERDAEVAAMRVTLEGIAKANWREWDEGLNTPEQFVTWAKSRANHALASTAGTDFAERLKRAEEERDQLRNDSEIDSALVSELCSERDAHKRRAEELNGKLTAAESVRDKLAKALIRLRDCDWVISLPDRMDAVRDIARDALKGAE